MKELMLYIDPGTGSMLFTVLIGILGTAFYLLRGLLVKIRFWISGGKSDKKGAEDRIPFAVFSDSKRYWNLFGPVCDEFEKRGQKLLYLTASPDDPALQKTYENVSCEFIGEGNKAFAKLGFLKADVLLSTTPGLEVYQWKRSKDVKWYVHAPHAASDITIYRMFGLDYYDAVLLSGEYQIDQIRQLETLRKLPEKELKLVGVPYLDAMKKRLEEADPLPPHPVTVLLAPSWGPSGILSRYGEKAVRALLNTGYHVIVRPHPQSFTSEKEMLEKLMAAFPESEQLEWNRDNDNFEVLRRSDVMISDYSGVIFDYSLIFDRPVIYADTSFDKSPYDAAWLEDELWTFQTLPKIGRALKEEDLGRIREVIDGMIGNPKYQAAIEAARKETWCHVGEGAERIADYMIRKEENLAEEARKAAAGRQKAEKKKEKKRDRSAVPKKEG